LKTELLINVAAYYICQDPSSILFVQPTQSAAESFSKERFAPTIEVTPQLRARVEPPRSRDSENTIAHKAFPGGSIDFVGANSPTDLASRPKRIILADEIDKYPLSAGAEGDPLKLAEERASTYKAIGRAKFVRTCSPTIKGLSRIGREYAASDQRRLFVACPHCDHDQVLDWSSVRWDKDELGQSVADTAALVCSGCGAVWSERDRVAALDALARKPDYGWRQTADFICCGEKQTPQIWSDQGRARCAKCGSASSYGGHAGFHVSKLYSKRHRLPEIVKEFLEAQHDQELLRKWTNTALAELWEQTYNEAFDEAGLIRRAETYSGDDLPEAVKVITGFCDVQGNRLEVQLVGWGADEEAWPFRYEIIHQDPAQPQAWRELDALLRERYQTVSGRRLAVAAFGIDTGGHHGAQVFSFCTPRRGRRIFACKGIAGPRPIWPGRATRAKRGDALYLIGVDTAKEAIYARLRIDPPEPGTRRPGFIHFPVADHFGPEYFEQLNSERRVVRKRMGQSYAVWEQIRDRNEALDTFVGALAMRKSLPRFIQSELEYAVSEAPSDRLASDIPMTQPEVLPEDTHQALIAARRQRAAPPRGFVGARGNWMDRR
jgi:phage terminase large subunit GpA-like protein